MRKARCATAVAEESPAPASDSPKPAEPGPEVGMVCKHEAIGSVRDKFAIADAMTLNDLLGRSLHNSSTNWHMLKGKCDLGTCAKTLTSGQMSLPA